MKKPTLIQISGYSNSGKTTLITKLIHKLNNENIRVSVIKHHGHENRLAALDTGKDSEKFRRAGASGTTVVAGNTMQLQFENDMNWSVSDALQIQKNLDVDFVIIEGFKKEPFPKIVLLKDQEDVQLLEQLENIQAVIVWDGMEIPKELNVPYFSYHDFETFYEWLIDDLKNKKI